MFYLLHSVLNSGIFTLFLPKYFSLAERIMSTATVPCVLYKDRVFCGNLTTQILEEDIMNFLWKRGFQPGHFLPF